MKTGRLVGIFKLYLNEVQFVVIGKDSIHSVGQLWPAPGDWEGMETITMGVQSHVDGAWGGMNCCVNGWFPESLIQLEKIQPNEHFEIFGDVLQCGYTWYNSDGSVAHLI